MPLSTHPPPNQRGVTSYHDCDLVAAGQHHAPSVIGE